MNNISNFISVEASAGSGKTHNLTKRYISLLLNFDLLKKESVPLQNILALTFTNKASVEMKERIIESLKKIALNCDVKDLTSDISLPKDKISQNALVAINALIHNYDKFNVRTTDSFINLIIKACALKLGISPNYQISESYDDYIDYSIDSFLDKVILTGEDKALLNDFFERFLVDGNNTWNVKGFISTKFKEFYKKEISKDLIAVDKYKDYLKVLLLFTDDFNKKCLSLTKIKGYDGLDGRFKNVLEKIKNDKKYLFQPVSKISAYFQKNEPPYKKTAAQNILLNDLFNEIKETMENFFEYRAFGYYDTYLKIFNCIIDEFDIRSQKDSVLFLQDINRKILKVFQNTLMPEIYYRLSNNFKDFLMDEFQDTNKVQWETLKVIVQENLSQKGSFFYVGDKKQAIYGFRGSDFQIFDLPLNEFKNYSHTKLVLKTNYRSCEEIVNFNNSVFSVENIKKFINFVTEAKNILNTQKYGEELVNVFENSRQEIYENRKGSGYVEISCKEYLKQDKDDVDEKIKDYVFGLISDLKNRFDYKDITILCRHNDEVEKIGKWLLERNINIESFKTLNIKNSNVVKELFSILSFLNNPMDDISFTAFITGAVFLKRTGLGKNEIFDFLYENSFNKSGKNVLYVKFREKYPQVWKQYIDEFFKSVGFVAVYELAIAIISKFEVMENFKKDANVILRFLELISDFETKKQGLQNFIDYFKDDEKNRENEKFFVKVPSNNAIKIMSIHKAKGLQFNVVIMPYFYIGKVSSESPFVVENTDKVSFVKIEKDLTKYSDKLNDIYYKKYFKNLSDELNILYVATTRAVYEFYGLITKEAGSKDDFTDFFIKQEYRLLGKKQNYEKKEKEKISCMEIEPARFDDITDLLCDSSAEIYGRRNKDSLLKGQIVHYALSLIEKFDIRNLNAVIEETVNKVKIVYPDENVDFLNKILTKLLSQKDILNFFEEENEVFNEKEFVDKFGNTLRVDKLVIRKGIINIIDFKSSMYDEDYIKKQMEKYYVTVKEIYSVKEISCFVIDIEKNCLIRFF